MPDYVNAAEGDLLGMLGIDARKWAEAFCQIKQAQGWSAADIDEGLMTTWFANAIMAMHDHLQPERAPVVLPDGSAVVVH